MLQEKKEKEVWTGTSLGTNDPKAKGCVQSGGVTLSEAGSGGEWVSEWCEGKN